jgi:hypothetical protein
VNFIAFVEQKLGQVSAILPRDAKISALLCMFLSILVYFFDHFEWLKVRWHATGDLRKVAVDASRPL